MWEQKKANTPQNYNPMYGVNSGQQSGQQLSQQQQQQQQQEQQRLQQLQHLQQIQQYQQMSAAMNQQSLGQGLGPPPPYSPYVEQQQQQMKYMSQLAYNQNQYMAQQMAGQSTQASSMQSYPNAYYANAGLYQYNPYPTLPPNTTVVMPQGFDAGARFDGISRPVIPPPPPGAAPNAAQLAAMQGQNAVVGQKKQSFLEGGSSGGYTFW